MREKFAGVDLPRYWHHCSRYHAKWQVASQLAFLLDTDCICAEAGFRFVPLAIEAHSGSFSSSLRGVLDWVASPSSAATRESKELVSLRIAQRVSCVLHRECARAVLRRATSSEDPECSLTGWDEAVFEQPLVWQ